MKLIALLLLFQSATAFCKSYHLTFDFKVNGKSLSTPHIVLEQGSKGSVYSKSGKENFFLDVTANEGDIQGNKGIMLDFVSGLLQKDGSQKIISRGKVLVADGESATVLFPQPDNSDDIEINILAKTKHK